MNFSDSYENRQKKYQNDSVTAIKTILFNLKKNGHLGEITMNYSGSGDSGEYEPFQSDDFDLDDASANELERHVGGLLPPGWEINEGSYGTVTLNTTDGSIHVDHENIVEKTEYEDFDF